MSDDMPDELDCRDNPPQRTGEEIEAGWRRLREAMEEAQRQDADMGMIGRFIDALLGPEWRLDDPYERMPTGWMPPELERMPGPRWWWN